MTTLLLENYQALLKLSFNKKYDPESYIGGDFWGCPGYDVLDMMQHYPSKDGTWRSEISFETGIRTLVVLDRSDTTRRRMIGSRLVGAEHLCTTLEDRKMFQRWFKETQKGKAEHVDMLYQAISQDPGRFVRLLAPPKKSLLWRLRRKSNKKRKRTAKRT